MTNNIRTFRVNNELWAKATQVAKENNTTVSEVIRTALQEYINQR